MLEKKEQILNIKSGNIVKDTIKEKTSESLRQATSPNISVSKTSKLIKKMLEHAYKYNSLSNEEEVQIISQLEDLDLNKDWFSKWTEWSVFKIEVKDKDGNTKEYLVAKKRYDNDPINEWHIHNRIQQIIKKQKIDTSLVTIPELRAVLDVEDDNFIIMEFVKGKTLYQIEIEEIFKKRWFPVWNINSDIEAEWMFFRYLNLNPINQEDCKKASNFYYKELESIKLFPPEQWEKYKKALDIFLKQIHKEWIYHRDISNPRNIMIGENGKIYIIDFWKSIDIKWQNISEKQIYEKQEWELTWYYPKDEEILLEIKKLTKTQEDVSYEKEKEHLKQKIKKIEKSDSVLSILWDIPHTLASTKKQRDSILEKIKTIGDTSKRVKLLNIQEAKTNKERLALLFIQSYENINHLLTEIIESKWVLYEEEQKELSKKNIIPSYVLRLWKEAISSYKSTIDKKITNIHKKLMFLDDIEKKVIELEKLTKLKK